MTRNQVWDDVVAKIQDIMAALRYGQSAVERVQGVGVTDVRQRLDYALRLAESWLPTFPAKLRESRAGRREDEFDSLTFLTGAEVDHLERILGAVRDAVAELMTRELPEVPEPFLIATPGIPTRAELPPTFLGTMAMLHRAAALRVWCIDVALPAIVADRNHPVPV